MLRRLRKKFVAIVMALVGMVLVAVLGSAYIATYQTQHALIADSLERRLYGDIDDRPMIGMRMHDDDDEDDFDDDGGPRGGMLSLLAHVSSEGIVLELSDVPVIVNTQALTDVIGRVINEGVYQGDDTSMHIAWSSMRAEDDSWLIALVDTSQSDTMLRELAIRDLQIIAIALVTLFAISWWLSDWALRPVERAWEQQRRFVADASHELKTPLAVISANTQILQNDVELSTEARRWVDSTAEETDHMKALVGDLLQLARADETAAGVASGAMRHDQVNLSEMVESSALEFDAIAFEHGCLIEESIAENVQVVGDPEWLERLVRILIDNACKYAEPGTTIDVRLLEHGGKAHLSVHNDGNPIDPDDLPHVFERFYRSDKARTRSEAGGFGLGLAIAKGIADAHGGKISVESTSEAGTTFSVVI